MVRANVRNFNPSSHREENVQYTVVKKTVKWQGSLFQKEFNRNCYDVKTLQYHPYPEFHINEVLLYAHNTEEEEKVHATEGDNLGIRKIK